MTAIATQRDEAWARRVTERIRLTGLTVKENLAKLQGLLEEAREGGAAELLGYKSWTAYLADVFGEEPLRLPRDQRQELVAYLAGEGMSTRAIAPIVGADHVTVSRDIKAAPVANATPAPAAPDPAVDTRTGEVLDHLADAGNKTAPSLETLQDAEHTGNLVQLTGPAIGREVTGLDGKTYTRPTRATTPKRKPITDQFFTAAYDMGKAIERVHRLIGDDRYPQNAEKVAAKHRNDLLRSQDLLQQVIDSLPTQGV